MNSIHTLLLDSLHQDPDRFPAEALASLDEYGWESLHRLAIEYRVVPLLHYRLSSSEQLAKKEISGKKNRSQMAFYTRQVSKKNLWLMSELKSYLDALASKQIPVILLKGIWLAREVYPNIGMREMGDIDLLFHTDDLPLAADLLMKLGYKPEKPIDFEKEIRKIHHLTPFVKNEFLIFELHWNITQPGKKFYIDPGHLWNNATESHFDGKPVSLLSIEDFLLHLCAHAVLHHHFSFGLRAICDIAQMLHYCKDKIDWGLFARQAINNNWEKGVWLALDTAKHLVGANVPRSVLETLKPESTSIISKKGAISIHTLCRDILFTEKLKDKALSLEVYSLFKKSEVEKKWRTLARRIFPTLEEMKIIYSIKGHSKWIYLYYFQRMGQLLFRYGHRMLGLNSPGDRLLDVYLKKQLLKKWLDDKA